MSHNGSTSDFIGEFFNLFSNNVDVSDHIFVSFDKELLSFWLSKRSMEHISILGVIHSLSAGDISNLLQNFGFFGDLLEHADGCCVDSHMGSIKNDVSKLKSESSISLRVAEQILEIRLLDSGLVVGLKGFHRFEGIVS